MISTKASEKELKAELDSCSWSLRKQIPILSDFNFIFSKLFNFSTEKNAKNSLADKIYFNRANIFQSKRLRWSVWNRKSSREKAKRGMKNQTIESITAGIKTQLNSPAISTCARSSWFPQLCTETNLVAEITIQIKMKHSWKTLKGVIRSCLLAFTVISTWVFVPTWHRIKALTALKSQLLIVISYNNFPPNCCSKHVKIIEKCLLFR